jgi:hypothetical protein
MSRLKDFVSKGVRLIVADDESAAPPPPEPESEVSPPPPPPRRGTREREITAATLEATVRPEVARSGVPASVVDFGAVYEEAGIELPLHGYGVEKVAEMLQGKRLAALGREVRATAVMAALEAAAVPLRDVIQDAVAKDRALDAFEAAKQREVQELRDNSAARVKAIREEIDAFLKDKNAEIEGLKQASDAAQAALVEMQTRKRAEEERLHDVVAHFVEGLDNPITTTANPAPNTAS